MKLCYEIKNRKQKAEKVLGEVVVKFGEVVVKFGLAVCIFVLVVGVLVVRWVVFKIGDYVKLK